MAPPHLTLFAHPDDEYAQTLKYLLAARDECVTGVFCKVDFNDPEALFEQALARVRSDLCDHLQLRQFQRLCIDAADLLEVLSSSRQHPEAPSRKPPESYSSRAKDFAQPPSQIK